MIHKKLSWITLISVVGLLILAACSPKELSVQDPAEDFELVNFTGEKVALSTFIGEEPVLLFFHMADG